MPAQDIFLDQLLLKRDLSVSQMETALEEILSGRVEEKEVVSWLNLLRDKGEKAEEIKGAVVALRKRAVLLSCKTREVLDTCGTGGDQKNTFNISTAVAFVVAGAGVAVAKHGNRAVSSQSGSADVLRACGVKVDASPEVVASCVDQIGIGFLFAPLYHATLKAVSAARQKIKTKTIFNILGPLLNPAGAPRQMIGVYDAKLLLLMGTVLKELGTKKALLVHGHDGLDEVTLTSKSSLLWVQEGKMREEIFDPTILGYPFCRPEELTGGTAEENAKRLKKTLKGHSQAVDHCVHINAAFALLVADRAKDIKEALLMAQESISSGRAYEKLERLVEMTNKT